MKFPIDLGNLENDMLLQCSECEIKAKKMFIMETGKIMCSKCKKVYQKSLVGKANKR